MHDLGDMLVRGFADPVMDQEVLTLQWRDADALLAELRGLAATRHLSAFPVAERRAGANTAPGARSSCQRSRPLGLMLRVAYGHAFRAAPKAPTSRRRRKCR